MVPSHQGSSIEVSSIKPLAFGLWPEGSLGFVKPGVFDASQVPGIMASGSWQPFEPFGSDSDSPSSHKSPHRRRSQSPQHLNRPSRPSLEESMRAAGCYDCDGFDGEPEYAAQQGLDSNRPQPRPTIHDNRLQQPQAAETADALDPAEVLGRAVGQLGPGRSRSRSIATTVVSSPEPINQMQHFAIAFCQYNNGPEAAWLMHFTVEVVQCRQRSAV